MNKNFKNNLRKRLEKIKRSIPDDETFSLYIKGRIGDIENAKTYEEVIDILEAEASLDYSEFKFIDIKDFRHTATMEYMKSVVFIAENICDKYDILQALFEDINNLVFKFYTLDAHKEYCQVEKELINELEKEFVKIITYYRRQSKLLEHIKIALDNLHNEIQTSKDNNEDAFQFGMEDLKNILIMDRLTKEILAYKGYLVKNEEIYSNEIFKKVFFNTLTSLRCAHSLIMYSLFAPGLLKSTNSSSNIYNYSSRPLNNFYSDICNF